MPESIQKTKKRRYKEGDIIFNQGDDGTEMYVIESGLVELFLYGKEDRKISLGKIGKNNFFGEMALFGNRKRTATAQAVKETVVVVINNRIMQNQLSKLPQWFVVMFRTLVERLRETDRRMINGEHEQ